ncbi:MAG: outer membrane protein TolC [Bacteroidia bacterium]|jgi:outer membrane protein TolC
MKNGHRIQVACCLFFVGCFLSKQLSAQVSKPINIEVILQDAGASNLTIVEHRLRYALSVAELEYASQWWLPNIYVGTTLHQLWGNTLNGDGRIFTNVNRQSFWGGAGFNATWDFTAGKMTTTHAKYASLSLEENQTIKRNEILLECIAAYYDLLATRMQSTAYAELLNEAQSVVDQLKIQFEAGILHESDLLLAQSNRMHLNIKMLDAQKAYITKAGTLKKYLGYDLESTLVLTDSTLLPLNLVDPEIVRSGPPLTFDTWPDIPQIRSASYALVSLKNERELYKSELFVPKLRVGGYTSYFGDVFTSINPTTEINATLVWELPMGRILKHGKLETYNAQISIQNNELKKVVAENAEEIRTQRSLIGLAKNQAELASEAHLLARKALDQSFARQKMGTIRPMEVVQTQEIYLQAKLDYLEAVADYNKAQYRLHVALGNNL